MDFTQSVKNLPLTSGVYLMKNKTGAIIYIGKAVSLRKRVQSYFRRGGQELSKTDLLVGEIKDIDYISTGSEAEALILEASLIKQYKPKYNVELRDDKSYPYIEITGEEFPRVAVVRPNSRKALQRETKAKKNSRYFGPYVNVALVREALKIIRKIFHFRTCHPFPDKACLDFHLGLCDAPCVGNISCEVYAKIIANVCLILEGKKDELYKNLRGEMELFVKERRFEEAAKVRDQLRAIGALYSGTKDLNYFKEVEQLQRVLNLPRKPERVEAFDISNMMGDQAVGSMVSFFNGKPDKSNYRRFRIKTVMGIDDFKMIGEIVRRRYSRLIKERALFPDLVVIDGGKGQLSSAKEELDKLGLDLPVIALAKREEEIFLPNKRHPVVLSHDSLALKLLQRIRDEAHRFAIAYHRKLRERSVYEENAVNEIRK